MDTIDIIVNKYLEFDQFGKVLMGQGYSNRFVAKIVYPCECLAKVLLLEQVSRFVGSSALSTDYLSNLSMMTPEEMRTRYLISENDSVAFNAEKNVVKAAYTTQDELLRLCKLLHSYILFMKTLNSFGK